MEERATQRGLSLQLASITAQLAAGSLGSRHALAAGQPQCGLLDAQAGAAVGRLSTTVCSAGPAGRPASSGSSSAGGGQRPQGGSGGRANFNFVRRAAKFGIGAGGGAAFLVGGEPAPGPCGQPWRTLGWPHS